MSYRGTVKNGCLELDQPIDLASGTIVDVKVEPLTKPEKGSARALLQIAGRLSAEEAEAILAAKKCPRVDPQF
jgi:hypothetical protein